MQFQLTDEQRALQDAVRSYLRDRFGPTQVRELYENDTDGVPAELWKAVNEQGWLAVLVPEEHDGLGLGLLDASVISRAFGAGTVPGPWLSTLIAGEAIRLAGSPAQQGKHLANLAAGGLMAAVALVRNGCTPNPAGAPLADGQGTLTGDLGLVEYAAVANLLVVASRDGGLHLVDPAGPGVTITSQDSLDRTTRLDHVVLDGAPGERLEASSATVLQEVLDRAAVLVANDLAGLARKALTDTVEYDKIRSSSASRSGRSRPSSTIWRTCMLLSRWPSTRRPTRRTPSTSTRRTSSWRLRSPRARLLTPPVPRSAR